MLMLQKKYSFSFQATCLAVIALLSLSACATTETDTAFAPPTLQSEKTEVALQTSAEGTPGAVQPQASYLPSGHAVSAPTGFLEMCERSPIDCEHSRPIDAAVIKTLARTAITAKLDQIFAGLGNNQAGITAATRATEDRTSDEEIAPSTQVAMHSSEPLPEILPETLNSNKPLTQTLHWTNKSESRAEDTAPQTGNTAASRTLAEYDPMRPTADKALTKQNPSDYLRIDYAPPIQSLVQAINDRVNRTLVPDTDAHIYNTTDYWTTPGMTPGTHADCEDYALEKRRLLIENGIPADALSLATVKTAFGEDHAVLLLSTIQGDFVLDNLQYKVKDWRRTDYTWMSRQSALDDLSWISLDGVNARSSRMSAQTARIAYNQ